VSVTSDSHVIEYLYDAQDKRVGKQLDGIKIERYIYDGEDIALVVDAQGTLIERYLYGDSTDSVLAVERDGTISWSLADRQGSVVDLVDEDGTVLNHFVYDSFGNRTQTSGVEFRYGYTGRELDGETGLYYYRARYYAPTTGRFISEDPMGFGAGDTNLYRYVNNSPTNYTDPTGMIGQIAGGAIFGGIAGGLYALANDLETGKFGWNTFGNVATGAAVGALTGAIVATGVGLVAGLATDALAAGFTAVWGTNAAVGTATAGAIVNTSITAGFTAYGAYSAGGNFGSGKYLTGVLDLVGVGIGAANVFSGVTRGIPNARLTDLATAIDNLPMPGSSALANRTSVAGEIVPYARSGAIILAADTAAITSQFYAGGIVQGSEPGGIVPYTNHTTSSRMISQEHPMSCGVACVRQFLQENGVKISESNLITELGINFDPITGTDAKSLSQLLNKYHPSRTTFQGGSLMPENFDALNRRGSWIARIKVSKDITHFVIVDGVKDGNVLTRDPWGYSSPSIGEGLEGEIPLSKFMDYWLKGRLQAVF
jgi:RHS repeat-associated protein